MPIEQTLTWYHIDEREPPADTLWLVVVHGARDIE
jgi:hypothetical protein